MATSQSEIKDQVRTLTDYDPQIINQSAMDDVISIAEDEIRSSAGDPSLTFYQGTDTFDLDLAVMWLSCIFAKVKTGEIDGPDMTLGDIEVSSFEGNETYWFERFQRAMRRFQNTRGFGRVDVSRDTRTYGDSF